MKIKLLLIPIFLFINTYVWAQTDYIPIQCEGIIPSEFITFTSEKVKAANENYKGKYKMQVSKRDYKRYNSESTFFVDYLLKNGLILFGTPMNDYVNRVGEYVLKSFPGIADEVRFYIVKSPSVNAFTNEQGIVFINIGLIAQLENEAQLAYIMSHELIHYKYNHSFESYKEKVKAASDWSEYRYLNSAAKQSRLLKYSREHELIADSLGFLESFANTKYSYDEALSVFDVLLYSNLPFNEVEFDTNFFNDANYTISPKAILKEVDLISNPEDYDDHEMTHPNIKKRRSMMIDLVTTMTNPNTKKFIISKEDFFKMQKQARFEMSNLYLSNLQYDKAFYNSYLLLRKYPNSDYLNKTIAFSVYGIAVQKKFGRLGEVIKSYKKIEGQSQRVNYLFRKISSKELSAIAVKLLWKFHKTHPDDEFVSSCLNASLKLLIEQNYIHYSSIIEPLKLVAPKTKQSNDSLSQDSTISFKKLSKEAYEDLSKYDKIRYDKKYRQYYGSKTSARKTIKTKNYLTVLSSESSDPDFKTLYKTVERQSDGEQENGDQIVRSVLLVNPVFYRVRNDVLVLKDGEMSEKKFTKSITDVAARNSIKVRTLDILDIKQDEVDKFNDLTLLNAWLNEYGDLTDIEDMQYMIPWLSNYTNDVRKKYHLRYIANSGLLEIDNIQRVNSRIQSLIGAMILWQASPYFIANALGNDNELYHYFYLVDMETNQLMIEDYNQMSSKPTLDVVNSMNYYSIYKIKRSK